MTAIAAPLSWVRIFPVSNVSKAELTMSNTARVINEELLKDFADRPEMSDWFSREDIPEPPQPLPLRDNPKNLQNAAKMEELQERVAK